MKLALFQFAVADSARLGLERALVEDHVVERGLEFIDPVPLVSPDKVKPPPELAGQLHFNDWVLAYMGQRQ